MGKIKTPAANIWMRQVNPVLGLLKITLLRSGIHSGPSIYLALKALGLSKINHYMIHKNNGPIRGLIQAVKHMVKVEEIPVPKEVFADSIAAIQKHNAKLATINRKLAPKEIRITR